MFVCHLIAGFRYYTSFGWVGRRHPNGSDLHSADFLPVPLPLPARRFGLYGARGLRHGPADADGRTAWKGGDPDDGRVRLHSTRSDGDPYPRRPA